MKTTQQLIRDWKQELVLTSLCPCPRPGQKVGQKICPNNVLRAIDHQHPSLQHHAANTDHKQLWSSTSSVCLYHQSGQDQRGRQLVLVLIRRSGCCLWMPFVKRNKSCQSLSHVRMYGGFTSCTGRLKYQGQVESFLWKVIQCMHFLRSLVADYM